MTPRFPWLALVLACVLHRAAVGQTPRTPQKPRTPFAEEILTTPQRRPFGSMGPARTVRELSLIYIDEPEPRELKVHDIVTVIVDEKSRVSVTSRFDRQRNGTLKAELKEFLRIDDNGNLANAALNAPTIDGTLQNRFQANGQMTDGEGIQYRIAAVVVDVLPNGNLVLEARKSIRSNRDIWEYSLTGTVRSKDVAKDNTVLSENIAYLNIEKHQRGKVYDSTKRAWGTLIYDVIFPF